MSTWRERFLTRVGPGVLAGITLHDWLRLLRDNDFNVDSPYLARAGFITLAALINSPFRCFETFRYRRRLADVTIPPPLFVLGHWRSGTTHLHYLLGRDRRFACPGLYECHYPHTFLSSRRHFSALTRWLLIKHRPYDNVRLDLDVPYEDEFAMCVSGFRTIDLAGVFPRRVAHYDRFLTFRDASPEEIDQWKQALLLLLRKITLRHGKPLIIKSPNHTGRIKLLLEMFPDAKFVHIHRDPFTVFQSFLHTYATGLPYGSLQRPDRVDWAARIIRQYRELHDAFFEQRPLIPAGHFHELRFTDLERDPISEVRRMYEALSLPDFAPFEPDLRRYVESQSDYKKNAFPQLAPGLRRRLATEWRRCFEEWGYPVQQ